VGHPVEDKLLLGIWDTAQDLTAPVERRRPLTAGRRHGAPAARGAPADVEEPAFRFGPVREPHRV